MNTALLQTDNGLQVRTGAAASSHANRVHSQPGRITPAGRNSFVLAEREGRARWEDTYVTAEAAASFLALSAPEKLGRYIADGLLQPYRRQGSQRRLFKRAQVEELVQPSNEKVTAHGFQDSED